MIERNHIYNCDCMEGMREMPDNYVDLAIVDPPYGIGIGSKVVGDNPFGSKAVRMGGQQIAEATVYKGFDDSQIPNGKYFNEGFRISKNQIIWGGNYFLDYLGKASCMIVWDKDNSGNFADCEIAWTSFDTASRIFKYRWNGMLQENMKRKEKRIHPTQKPVALYKWLLQNYAKEGDLILDTHMGSGSSYIACLDMGFDYIGYEIDADYFKAIEDWVYHFTRQEALFDVQIPKRLRHGS